MSGSHDTLDWPQTILKLSSLVAQSPVSPVSVVLLSQSLCYFQKVAWLQWRFAFEPSPVKDGQLEHLYRFIHDYMYWYAFDITCCTAHVKVAKSERSWLWSTTSVTLRTITVHWAHSYTTTACWALHQWQWETKTSILLLTYNIAIAWECRVYKSSEVLWRGLYQVECMLKWIKVLK